MLIPPKQHKQHKQQRRGDLFTPLHIACLRNFLRVVATLIDLRADVNAIANNDIMPLHVRDA